MVTARLCLTHDEAFLSVIARVVAALTLLSVSSVTNFTPLVIASKAGSVLVQQPIVDILITYCPFRCRRFVITSFTAEAVNDVASELGAG